MPSRYKNCQVPLGKVTRNFGTMLIERAHKWPDAPVFAHRLDGPEYQPVSWGKLLSDVTNIDTEAVLASNDLTFPAEYEEVASTKELSPFKQVVKQVRQHSPQVNQIYEQVDRFGQHLQDRYRQYWQR